MTAPERDAVDDLAYLFWSIHPKDIPEATGMPEGYKGGKRSWFYANQMRSMIAAAVAARLQEAAGVVADLGNEFAKGGSPTAKGVLDLAIGRIRTLITADEADALAEVKRQARVEGMRALFDALADTGEVDDEGNETPILSPAALTVAAALIAREGGE